MSRELSVFARVVDGGVRLVLGRPGQAGWRAVVARKNYFCSQRLSWSTAALLAMAVSVSAPAAALPLLGRGVDSAVPSASGIELVADPAPPAASGPDQAAKGPATA